MKLCVILAGFLAVVNGQKIAGGEEVSIAQYPFATALLSNYGEREYKQACGGSIITETVILSAASCFVTDGSVQPVAWWRARVGSANGNSYGTIYIVNRITVHPDFDDSLANDVAILRTRLSMSLVPGVVETVNIAAGVYLYDTHKAVKAVGWGDFKKEDSSLHEVQFWIVDHKTCINRYAAVNRTVSEDMVCVGWLDVGVRGQCPGTAGSPLVINSVVVGLYSYTGGDCLEGWFPNINTKISSYAQWIAATARVKY